MLYTTEFELEEFLGVFFITVLLEFEYNPGEPMVRYTPNGDGYPGSPAEVTPVEATVTSMSAVGLDKTRDDLVKEGWATHFDELALEACCEQVDKGDWLRGELFDVAAHE